MNYSEKGEKEVCGSDYQEFNLNYIEIPVLAKYTFGKNDFKAFIEGGPYVAYWQSGKIEYKIVEYEMKGNDSYDFGNVDVGTLPKDNRLDIGLDLGGGVMYQLGPGNILLDARLGYGLTTLMAIRRQTSGWKNKENRVISISLGYG